ncbi:MAG TPA: SDR family oxidoreductase [Gemmatimonadales bacterium]|nr:SDR family oxidoreductase [Gemmatimonadales bacterium]
MTLSIPLAGRHAIVTGGARGIGAAIASELAAQGATLTLMGRDAAALGAQAVALRKKTAEVLAIRCDVADPASVAAAFAESRDRFPRPWLLVNNAGHAAAVPFMETSPELWAETLGVNLLGAVACIREVLPAMLQAKGGRIVNIASMAGIKGYGRITAYSASKHALVGLTRSLAAEVRREGVTVNAVCPGYTESGMSVQAEKNIVEGMKKSAEEARAMVIRHNPRGKILQPEEVAHVVAWIAAPSADAINGRVIPVSGGEV